MHRPAHQHSHRPLHLVRFVRAIAALLAIALPTSGAPASEATETWYVVQLSGAKSGWMLERTSTDAGRISSDTEMSISMKRGGAEVTISLASSFVETDDGTPISMSQRLEFGGTPAITSYTWNGDTVEVKTGIGPNAIANTVPAPEGDWLTPTQADEFVRALLAERAGTIEFDVIEPGAGLSPVTTTMSNFTEANIEVFGAVVAGLECDVVASNAPQFVSRYALSLDGDLLRTSIAIGALDFTVLRATKELALSPLEAPEVMNATFVSPSRKIDSPRSLKRATYTLSVPDGSLADLPTAGVQRATRVDDRTIRLEIITDQPLPAEIDERDTYLARSAMLDTEDRAVRALANGDKPASAAKAMARAEFLRGVVYGHIANKNLGVGFASASDVARSRSGDCSEHATLLAALLRVEGIPSRVVSGLIYADSFAGSQDIFGYHMWTQAMIEVDGAARWIDLDPTLPPWSDFDATHIAISTTALSDDVTTDNAMLELAPLLGRLQIRVDETE